jgi:hypothetical protein
MNLPISVVPAAPAKHNQPCCIKIVKWFYPTFAIFWPLSRVELNRSVARPESFATIARAASHDARKRRPESAQSPVLGSPMAMLIKA